MKKTTLFLFSLLISLISLGQVNSNQEKVDSAFRQSFATGQDQLQPIIQKLKEDQSANTYWIAYAQLYQSIFFMQTGQKDQARSSVEKAIELLQNADDKNSEGHALLGYILGYSISLDPSAAGRLSAKAASEYKEALKKNENNMRAYLGMGESDFYKPAAFGGGEKVEEYLLKAISLDEQTFEDGPSWGENRAFYLLSSFYQREGQTDKAKLYCMQGLNKYPDDQRLNQLKQSF